MGKGKRRKGEGYTLGKREGKEKRVFGQNRSIFTEIFNHSWLLIFNTNFFHKGILTIELYLPMTS